MSDSNDTGNGTGRNADSTFLHRWSLRKLDQQTRPETKESSPAASYTPEAVEPAGPEELPDVDTLDENSEVSMFFSEQVSETLKRQALRKLFHMDKFNFCDGLDDYAEDYTLFEPLGNTITAHQRLQKEREAISRLVNEDKVEPAVDNAPQEQEHLLQADNDNTLNSADESENEPWPADETERKES